eukprot:COSAG01_NODE_2740_length_7158_cov_3.142371_2_plen_85_part_00
MMCASHTNVLSAHGRVLFEDRAIDAFKLRIGDKFGGVGREIKDLSQTIASLSLQKTMSHIVCEVGPFSLASVLSAWADTSGSVC